MTSSPVLSVRISGAAMSTITGSELYQRPHLYTSVHAADHQDGIDAGAALQLADRRPAGKGWSYLVTCSPGAARVIRGYCDTVGETFANDTEPETRAEGRALLVVRDRIDGLLAP